jgi:tetratricopeptide (TPR) repeat protein
MLSWEDLIGILADPRVQGPLFGVWSILAAIEATAYAIQDTSLKHSAEIPLWIAIAVVGLACSLPWIVRLTIRRWAPQRDVARNWRATDVRIWTRRDLAQARRKRRDSHDQGGGIDRLPIDIDLFIEGRTGDLQADFSLLLAQLDEWLAQIHRNRDPGLPIFWITSASADERSFARLACLAHLTRRRLLVGDARRSLDAAVEAVQWSTKGLPTRRPRVVAVDLRRGLTPAAWTELANVLERARAGIATRERPREVVVVAGDAEQANEAGEILKGLVEFRSVAPMGVSTSGPASQCGTSIVTDRVYNRGLPATGADLFGRDAELRWLDEAWADSNVRVVSIVAVGGTGKSAVLNSWLEQMRSEGYPGAEKVLLWSFYSQGTREELVSADPFVNDALAWLGSSESQKLGPAVRGETLAKLIAAQRMLVVLDGLEPLQHPPDREAVGGMLTNISIKTLLERLAESEWGGLCVITTRFEITDLRPLEEGERSTGAVATEQLPPLDNEDGVKLLRSVIGDRPPEDQMTAAVEEYRGHALALILLGTYIREACGGDLKRRALLEEIPLDKVREGAHARRVMAGYESWLTSGARHLELAILKLIGLFDRPAEPEAMAALLEGAGTGLNSGVTEPRGDRWTAAVGALQDMGLLNRQSGGPLGSLDAHPLVREYFRHRVKADHSGLWRAGNLALYAYYTSTVADEQPSTREEMQLLYTAVTHGCAGGEHQLAFDEVLLKRIWRDRRTNYSTRHLGLTSADVAALSNYFERGQWTKLRPVPLSSKARVLILTNAGVRLRQLGQLLDARASFGSVADEFDQVGAAADDREAASYASAQNAELLVIAGQLDDREGEQDNAVDSAARAITLAAEGDDPYFEMHAHGTLGEARLMLGDTQAAAACFDHALEIDHDREPEPQFLYSQGLFRYGFYLIEHSRAQAVIESAAADSEWGKNGNDSSLLSQAIRLLVLGAAHRALLERGPSRANLILIGEQHLNTAVTRFREAGYTDYAIRGLLERARFHRVAARQGDADRHRKKAIRDLREASAETRWDFMRLLRADVDLEKAALQIDAFDTLPRGEQPTARREIANSLRSARTLVDQIGYGRRTPMLEQLEAWAVVQHA